MERKISRMLMSESMKTEQTKKIGVLALLFVLGTCTCPPAGGMGARKNVLPKSMASES